ncbi:hypothetical protein L6164_001498 [Bauhinia variegata]|uniref:Uncharacterized protein n=1 Tax=Bauhinia variegata TaxID=167791 RepID=A0ACB9Q9Z6_BAUVA|nr:hypothetical protein L6164_001498 [Bauhinia variegata]
MAPTTDSAQRIQELKQFDEAKTGVKGLVDSGITSIPSIFINPPEVLETLKPSRYTGAEIPTIDLTGVNIPGHREKIVDQIKSAASTVGFFQVINHGVPLEAFDSAIAAVGAFHELPGEVKAPLYKRGVEGVSLKSNQDLFHSKAAYWRDTLMVQFDPKPADPKEIPEVCREQVLEYHRQTLPVAELLLGLLSEGLGLSTGRLKELTLIGGQTFVGNYYPYCPQPDLTIGFRSHTDPGVLTLLIQDDMGGLQVKYKEGWVDLKPVPGAIVINIGDLLQIVSNEEYKSVNHRVLAQSSPEPRISIATFYNPGAVEDVYGPLPELISPEKPALYREFTCKEYFTKFFTKEVDSTSQPNHFRK